MAATAHEHEVSIYYEDTDLTGAVYHANYLRYMERAREHLIGPQVLVDLYKNEGVGFVVYKANLTFREPAHHGDVLVVRTRTHAESRWRLAFDQRIFRRGEEKELVEGAIELVCVDGAGKLVALPERVWSLLALS